MYSTISDPPIVLKVAFLLQVPMQFAIMNYTMGPVLSKESRMNSLSLILLVI